MAIQNVTLGNTLELVCSFMSFPPSDGVFLRNHEVLSVSDSRINVDTTNISSTLTITNIRDDEGGNYSCRFNNSLGTTEIEVTTLTILCKFA